MEYEFKLPDGRRFPVKSWGNLPVELAAHLAGFKPVIHCWIQAADRSYLDALGDAFGLKALVFARQGEPGAERLGVMLGRDERETQDAALAWTRPRSNPGPELGYPPCCIKFYCAWLDDPTADSGPDIVRRILANTPEPVALAFPLNDAYYLYSRRGRVDDGDRREAVVRLNAGLDMNVLNAIPWHPCSYRCAPSLKAGRATLDFLSRACPALAGLIRSSLAHPVVFWDWDRFAALRATGRKGRDISYDAILPPFTALDARDAELLRAGNRLRLEPGRSARVYAGRRALGELAAAAFLDFASD